MEETCVKMDELAQQDRHHVATREERLRHKKTLCASHNVILARPRQSRTTVTIT